MSILKFFYSYWRADYTSVAQKHFPTAHIISLIIIAFLIYLTYILKYKLKDDKKEKIYSYILGTTLIVNQVSLYYWYIDNSLLTLRECLPLYLCRLSIILCILMIITKSHNIFDIVYFWGLGGAGIALFFNDTSIYTFPHYVFIQFFICHGGIVISIFFMMFVHNYTPNLTSLKRTFKWTIIYFIITIPTNYLLKSNYSYLRCKPNFPLLNQIPTNPFVYVPLFIICINILFVLLYLPFYKTTKTKN
ncbi:TIGR02206 family membrane protein [Clostridium algoriphilum]|uniref:YwaF family protein n=1 Tax=Clostridium algoriphilum TaxID=198347 RepID=UPI001CF57A5B|nr:TIGR02206 family membrane protein [Clostridium algoriphilum]MCB2294242.1 TIGR02206 family membrane protein [Clostridium algoriphilum]